MTGREKVLAAFSPEGTPQIPAVICYEHILFRDHWEELTDCPWWYYFDTDLARQMAWRREAHARIGQDWLRLPIFCRGDDRRTETREDRAAVTLEEHPDGVYRVDRRTGGEERLVRPGIGGWSASGTATSALRPDRVLSTPEEIDAATWVPEASDLPRALADGRADLIHRMREELAADRFAITHVSSPIESLDGLLGFQGMMMAIVERPDLVRHACERHLAWVLHAVREAAALGIDGVWIEECLTDMISPAAYAVLGLPYVQALTEEIRGLGMKSIFYFCGNPAHHWDLIMQTGADALALEEGKKGWSIDIAEVAERVEGHFTLLGNLDAVGVLEQASDGELAQEIGRQIGTGRRNGSRFIMSVGSPVTPGTSIERVHRYCDLVHELGRP